MEYAQIKKKNTSAYDSFKPESASAYRYPLEIYVEVGVEPGDIALDLSHLLPIEFKETKAHEPTSTCDSKLIIIRGRIRARRDEYGMNERDRTILYNKIYLEKGIQKIGTKGRKQKGFDPRATSHRSL